MTPSWVLCLETAVVGKICFWPLPGGTACELWSMEAMWMIMSPHRIWGGKEEAELRPWVMETAQVPGNGALLAAPIRGTLIY